MEKETITIDPISGGKFELHIIGKDITIIFNSRGCAENFLIKLLTSEDC